MYRVEHIDPSTTAFIVVDMQNDFVAPGAPMELPAGRAMVPTPPAGARLLPRARHPGHLHGARPPGGRVRPGALR